MLFLLVLNFVIGSRLELMYISRVINIRSSLIHPRGFQLLVLLPFVSFGITFLHQKLNSDRLIIIWSKVGIWQFQTKYIQRSWGKLFCQPEHWRTTNFGSNIILIEIKTLFRFSPFYVIISRLVMHYIHYKSTMLETTNICSNSINFFSI